MSAAWLAIAFLLGGPVPLELPPPLALPQCQDKAEVSHAVQAALESEGWTVREDTGGSVRAELSNRMHVLRIRVDYAPGEALLDYVDSQHLGEDERDGRLFVAAPVNRWLRDLAGEIGAFAARSCSGRGPVEVVPLPEEPRP